MDITVFPAITGPVHGLPPIPDLGECPLQPGMEFIFVFLFGYVCVNIYLKIVVADEEERDILMSRIDMKQNDEDTINENNVKEENKAGLLFFYNARVFYYVFLD